MPSLSSSSPLLQEAPAAPPELLDEELEEEELELLDEELEEEELELLEPLARRKLFGEAGGIVSFA